MIRVRVTRAMGARITGPVRLKLTKAQWSRRAAILGDWSRGGVVALDGGQALSFKAGEVLGIEAVEGRLNMSAFELVDLPEPEAAPAAPGDGGEDGEAAGGEEGAES